MGLITAGSELNFEVVPPWWTTGGAEEVRETPAGKHVGEDCGQVGYKRGGRKETNLGLFLSQNG